MGPFNPTHVSHKQVEAHPIAAAEFDETGAGKVALAGGRIIPVPAGFASRGAPAEGDMLVRYAPTAEEPDGYFSHSPRAVFEAGYRPFGVKGVPSNAQHQGLPVAGYQPQSTVNVALVNEHKAMEERLLRHLDQIASTRDLDPRWYSIARTGFEQAFMALNRSVFRPGRAVLPEDAVEPRVPRHDPEAGPATVLGGRPHP